MAQPQTWAEALKINPKKLKEWQALAPDGVPVLVYVLQEGHASTDQYLAWASERYHLPVLGEDFFTHAFNAESARNLQFAMTYEWKPWMFPVEQWDGVTYVACVEPPENPIGNHVRLVLADPRTMQRCWTQIASTVTGTGAGADVPLGLSDEGNAKPFKVDLGQLDEDQLFGTHTVPAPAEAELPEPPPIEDHESSPLHRIPTEITSVDHIKQEVISSNADEVFAKLKTIYQHVFLMRCTHEKAKLQKWDNSITPKGKGIEVDLAFPTFLRIISKTHLPYHGYLVDSPAHRDFFSNLNLNSLPGCVTGLPINGDNELLGVLVGVGDEGLQKLDFLKQAETMAQGLVAALRTTWSTQAA